MRIVEISIKDPKRPPKLTFPDRCVHCGKPKARLWPVKLNTGAQKRGQVIQVEFEVPLCGDCAAKENKIANVTWLPFFIVGFLVCAVVFIPVWLLSPEGTMPQTDAFPYVLGAFVGMIAGILVGSLVEFGLRMLFAPAYGRLLLLKRPLTIFSIFNDTEDLIGLSIRFAENRKILKLLFENDETAHEFASLNPQENV